MALNDTGKKHLGIIILLALGAIIVNELFILLNLYDIRWLGLFALPVIVYFGYRTAIINRLQDQVYTTLGFSKVMPSDFSINQYQISKMGRPAVHRVEQGNFRGQNVIIAYFTITIGSGRDERNYDFVGVELKTVSNTVSMQLYDNKNPLKPSAFSAVKLESEEFNKLFKVFVQNPTDAFYNLNPDTMLELIELRAQLNRPINIEYVGDKVFVYTDLKEYAKAMGNTLSVTEILNNQEGPDDVEIYKKTISSMIETGEKVYSLLNVKPK